MKIAWSIGHDMVHGGAHSPILEKYEHELASEVVRIGMYMQKKLNLNWNFLVPKYTRKFCETHTAGQVLRKKIRDINEWGADLAIESHFNSSSNSNANGCEMLYFSAPVGSRFSPNGKLLAEIIQDKTIGYLDLRDRGAKGMASLRRIYNGKETIPRYAFLTQTKMPAIITEPLFLSSPKDVELLQRDYEDTIYRLAMAIVSGILAYADRKEINLKEE